MEQYLIRGGNPLVGTVKIGGAKNSALGILAAAIMSDEKVTIRNLPDVNDINPSERRLSIRIRMTVMLLPSAVRTFLPMRLTMIIYVRSVHRII